MRLNRSQSKATKKETLSIIYHPDNRTEEITPEKGKFFRLKELQSIVGGYIECMYLNDDMMMIVNEEGKIKGLPYNHLATLIAIKSGYDNFIVGPALVCPSKLIK